MRNPTKKADDIDQTTKKYISPLVGDIPGPISLMMHAAVVGAAVGSMVGAAVSKMMGTSDGSVEPLDIERNTPRSNHRNITESVGNID